MNMIVRAPDTRARHPGPDTLTPSQKIAFEAAMAAHRSNALVLVESEPGMGKSTVLRAMHAETGGRYLDAQTVMRAHARSAATDYEKVVFDVIRDAFDQDDVVYYDDISEFQELSGNARYARWGLFDAAFKALYDHAAATGKRFVCTARKGFMAAQPPQTIKYRPVTITVEDLRRTDYEQIFASQFGAENLADVNFERLYGFFRKLSGYYLGTICDLLKVRGITVPTTDQIVTIVNEQLLRSNVDVSEVEAVALDTLIGVEEIVEKLERTILLPLQQPELARELGLSPKHGVILHGPPGTGKTTIGRALAHKMQGKFFLIDGDFDHESQLFFAQVQAIFRAAQRNAPAVIFIDDADVILTDPRLAYFGRYLLTQLDGLMNEASGRICVMMTAMDLRGLPLALLRSGRMEVWLEMQLPDEKSRIDMIAQYASRLPIAPPDFDVVELGSKTEGFTPADLRRVVGDATGHLALDRYLGDKAQPFEIYIDRAATALRDQKLLADEAFGRRGGRRFY